MTSRPETFKPLNDLAEVLLRADNSLTRGERELIATYFSHLNDCFFCQNAQGGLAQHYLSCDMEQMDKMKIDSRDFIFSEIGAVSGLSIAGSVQKGGKHVTSEQVEKAKGLVQQIWKYTTPF